MNHKLYILSLIIGLFSCQNVDKPISMEKPVSEKEEVENLSPHINVSQSKIYNDYGNDECIIELSVGKSIKKIDGFYPSCVYEENLVYFYIDLAKDSNAFKEICEETLEESYAHYLYPKKYGKLLNMSLAITIHERLYRPINRYCIFINDSKLTVTKDEINSWGAPEKDTINDFTILFTKPLASILNEEKKTESTIETKKTNQEQIKQEPENKMCYMCKGSGIITCSMCGGTGINNMGMDCGCVTYVANCRAMGKEPTRTALRWTCNHCNGTGYKK